MNYQCQWPVLALHLLPKDHLYACQNKNGRNQVSVLFQIDRRRPSLENTPVISGGKKNVLTAWDKSEVGPADRCARHWHTLLLLVFIRSSIRSFLVSSFE